MLWNSLREQLAIVMDPDELTAGVGAVASSGALASRVVPGKVVLVATPIGNLGDMSARAIEALAAADWIYAEDTRRTRPLLTHFGIRSDHLRTMHAHNEAEVAQHIVVLAQGGATIAYVSDAGMPAISDPGERLVVACANAGIEVGSVPGASAVLAAVALSGFRAVPFTFYGFLERKGSERRAVVETISRATSTGVIFEAANRLQSTIDDLIAMCGADRLVAVARELTKMYEEVRRGTLSEIAQQLADGSLTARGECVIVVAPMTSVGVAVDALAVGAFIAGLLDDGLRVRDVADAARDRFSIPKREAYDLAVKLARDR